LFDAVLDGAKAVLRAAGEQFACVIVTGHLKSCLDPEGMGRYLFTLSRAFSAPGIQLERVFELPL
jgi:hypothetical protein